MSYLQDRIFKLKGKLQHYSWGGKNYILQWLGIESKANQPCAEYWLGAHPSASSSLVTKNGELSLHQLIKEYPGEVLGEKVQKTFGELPYLLKILDVKDMLSIQVHPTREGAEKGFKDEEAAGILPSAAHRNYKDKNHKPELMIALSDFWLLHGFLPKDDLKKRIELIPEFECLKSIFAKEGVKGVYSFVMRMPQQQINELLRPLVTRELTTKKNRQLNKSEPGWWLTKSWKTKDVNDDIDRGIFSIYFFNIVHLNAGEAIYQGAGIPHAYLEGQNVELMANSDNVLRGGLTDKHIDVPELLKHISFEGIEPQVIRGEKITEHEINFPVPVPDFGIHKIILDKDEHLLAASTSVEILVVVGGSLEITGNSQISVKKGEALCILPGIDYQIRALSNTTAFKAFVP